METNWLHIEQEKLISISQKTIDGISVDSMIDPESLPTAVKYLFDKDSNVLTIEFKYTAPVEVSRSHFVDMNKSLEITYGESSKKIALVQFRLDLLNIDMKNDALSYEINRIKGIQRTLADYINDILDVVRKICDQKAQAVKDLIGSPLSQSFA